MQKQNETICGFSLKRSVKVPDVSGVLHEYYHERSGARLYYLDRADQNKTFAITFKTVPEDSTGVFHIIEHSVLCGSVKYPVKEPFVELLKSSLQTFLNAFTFPDKTMYPVSSRNDKDFRNLVSIYLDAVFYPLMKKNPCIFYQEGRHFEIDGERVTKNGVVLNEMRGEYSSPDTVETFNINEMLYRGTAYQHESGGHPDKIPALTYEDFVRAHDKYYHPSNAEIFLDGTVELEKTLSLIDSYLSGFEKRELDFPLGEVLPECNERRTVEYEIAKGESEEDKSRLAIGFMANRADEIERSIAIGFLIEVLTATNASPLKKMMLDSGLLEDFYITGYNGILENSVTVSFKNVKDGKLSEVEELFYESVRGIVRLGIDRERLRASINNLEFRQRERDFGTTPKGIIYAMAVEEGSLYGLAPEALLEFSNVLSEIRKKVDTDYFEGLLTELFLENPRVATLVMRPSGTLGERREAEERAEEEAHFLALSESERERISLEAEALKAWQESEDTEEAIATLPRLDISDISREPARIPQRECEVQARRALIHEIDTTGISYYDLYFDASDLTPDELFYLGLLTPLFSNLDTEGGTASDIQRRIKAELGFLDVSFSVLPKKEGYTVYSVVSAAALDSNRDKIVSLLSELLYTSRLDGEIMKNIYKQMKISQEESIASSGHQVAISRALSKKSATYAAKEMLSGYEFYERLKALVEKIDEELPTLTVKLQCLIDKIFVRERVTYATVGMGAESLLPRIGDALRRGEGPGHVAGSPDIFGGGEGVLIPSGVSYAACAAVAKLSPEERGWMHVVRMILNYEYLWGEIRVKGGAYGAGFVSRAGGCLAFYSYRDPNGALSYSVYEKASDALVAFAESERDLSGFIISAVGDIEPIMTPRLQGTVASIRTLSGRTYDEDVRIRGALLGADKEAILKIADKLREAFDNGAKVIVGGEDKLTPCEFIERTLKM